MRKGDARESTAALGSRLRSLPVFQLDGVVPPFNPLSVIMDRFGSLLGTLLGVIPPLAFLYGGRKRDRTVPNRVLIKWDPARDRVDELVAAVKSLCAGRPSTILTRRGSPLATQIKGEFGERGRMIYLKQGVSYPISTEDALIAAPTTPHVISLIRKARIEFGEPIAVVIDSLTDLAMILGTKKAYELVREMLDSLEEEDRVAAIIVGGAQGEREEMLFRSLFPDEFPLGKLK
ncbi:MAG: hypothetical protein QI223_10300 [Candidatus Korarchaeota archaeon]|nr:hypothetical protein [Candidatus Korarchaeota archaeon]